LGIYTYDEQYLRIDGEPAYRFVLYDDLMDEPVGNALPTGSPRTLSGTFSRNSSTTSQST
jgi:hypothetical protein